MKAYLSGTRRFPYHIILIDPTSGPAHQFCTNTADPFIKHQSGNRTVGLPAITNLPGQAGVRTAETPVPLIWLEPGFKFTAKQFPES